MAVDCTFNPFDEILTFMLFSNLFFVCKAAPDYAKWIAQLKDYRFKHGDFFVVPIRDKSLHNWVWIHKHLIKYIEQP